MSCSQAMSPPYSSSSPSNGAYFSSYHHHHHPHLHIPSTSPAPPPPPPASPQKSSCLQRMGARVESPSQRWSLNVRPDDVSATQRFLLNSAATKRLNRSQDGVTSSLLPSDDADQTPENAEYLGNNCVLLTYFSGDIGSHVDEHFSRALGQLQQQQQQQEQQQQQQQQQRQQQQQHTVSASDVANVPAGVSHQSKSTLSGSSTVKDCKTSSHWKASFQRHTTSTAYYACPNNRTQHLSTSIGGVGVPHDDIISSFDDWRYSFGAAFTNGVYDHSSVRGFGRSQINPLISNSFNSAINFPNGGDSRLQSAVAANTRWTPYERWKRMERTADDATLSLTGCDRTLSRSSAGGLTSSCQLQLPSGSKQPPTSDMYWF